jgi:hypothetical protein
MISDRLLRPSIRVIGEVTLEPDGTTRIRRWMLGPCLLDCNCHRHPFNKGIYILQSNEHGLLGLKQFYSCACCRPWGVAELAAVISDLAYLERMEEAL